MISGIIQLLCAIALTILIILLFAEQDKKIELLRDELKCVYGRLRDKHPDLPFNPYYD